MALSANCSNNVEIAAVAEKTRLRKTFATVLGTLVFSFVCASAPDAGGQSVYWNMQTAAPTSNTVGNLTVGDLIQGNNNGTTTMLGSTSVSSGYTFTLSGSTTSASGVNNAGASARAGNLNTGSSAYFEFSLTPASGYGFNFTSIGFGSRSTATGPKAFTLRSSLDSYASDLLTPGALASTSTWAYSTTSLTSGTSSTSAVTYRLFGYSGTGSPSANTANWRIDDLVLSLSSFSTGGTDLYFDGGNGWVETAPGAGGNGSWDNGAGAWDSAKTANFGGAAGTVTTLFPTTGRGIAFATSGYTLSGGLVTLNGSAIGLNAITTGSTTPFTSTINSVLAGTNGMTKLGAGTLVLGGANTFSGNLAISAGTLEISSESALGDATNDVTLGNSTLKTTASVSLGSGRDFTGSGTLDIAPSTTLTSSASFNLSATTLSNAGTLNLQGATRSVGILTFGTAATVNGSGPITVSGLTATGVTSGVAFVNPEITFTAGDKTVDVGTGGSLVLFGGVAGTTGRIIKTGLGSLFVRGTNSTSGYRLGVAGATPVNGGTLVLNTAAASGTAQLQLNYGELQVSSPQIFSTGLSIGGRDGAVAVLGGASAMTFTGSSNFFRATSTSGALRLDVNNATTLAGIVGATSGGGSTTGITIGGTGSLAINGDASALIDAITLQDSLDLLIGGTLGSAVTVGATNAIGGNGTILGSLTFNSGADFIFDIGKTLTVNGASVTFADFGISDLIGFSAAIGDGSYTLIDGSAIINTANLRNLGLANAVDLGGGRSAYFTEGSLVLQVVPEPSAFALAGVGLALAVASRLRRRTS